MGFSDERDDAIERAIAYRLCGCNFECAIAVDGAREHFAADFLSDQRALAEPASTLDQAGIGQREDYLFWSDALRWIRDPATRAVCLKTQ